MKTKLLILLISIANLAMLRAATLPVIPVTTFTVTDYGAVSSTTTDNTSYIQQTINACSAAGGGIVVIPAGTFLSGPLAMKSNVNLQISSGATLRMLPYGNGNGTLADTYPNSGTTDDYTDFIYGKNLTNIEVSGAGTVDGQGAAWWTAYTANNAIARPCMIRFDACTNIAILGLAFTNAPNVHITIGKSSSNTTIANVSISAPGTGAPNTDGIDVWSPNIDITNCNISTGDDNIAMDSGSQNIKITNCTFGYGHGCSIGSYASNITNILVDNCTFTNTTAGIRLKTARDRGGVEENITYSNITMTNVTNPIWITSYYPKVPTSVTADPAQTITTTTPSWQHITIKNVTITGSPNAGTIWGLPEKSINDVVLDNVKISSTTGMTVNYVTGLVFKNGSSITITSTTTYAVIPYSSTVSGILLTSGKANYVMTASALPASTGTISGTGAFTSGQTVTLTATPAKGYTFTKWTEGTTDVATTTPLTFSANTDRTLVANFSLASGIENINAKNSVLLFPNPTHDKFTLQIDDAFMGSLSITIVSESGRQLKKVTANKTSQSFIKELSIDSLPKGVYTVLIEGNLYKVVKKLIVE
jgi:polygalacturonase